MIERILISIAFLNEQQVRSTVGAAEVILAIRNAFAGDFQATPQMPGSPARAGLGFARDGVEMPVRTQLTMGQSILLLMPCHDARSQAGGVKIVTVNPLSGVNATYALLDPNSGKTLAVMEANYLTDLRTAATSAVATDLLARPEAETLGIFGSGRQARIHFSVLPHVRRFHRFLVCGSQRSDLAGFCSAMKQEQGIDVEPVNAETCVREADVLCTCSTSTQPLFDGHLLPPGTHLNLVGAFEPHTREVDSETVRRARVVVDTYEGALAEAGDLLIPLRDGVITRDHILADLHEIASGKKPGRKSPENITLFKSVGCALEDLVTANLIWRKKAVSI